MSDLSLEQALAMLAAVMEQARAANVAVAAAVIDRAGLPIAMHRMDGVFPAGPALAERKAFGALNLRVATHVAYDATPEAIRVALVAAEPRVTFLHGGVPLMRDGVAVGAVGVTGGTGEQDIACCEAALKAYQGDGPAYHGDGPTEPA